MTIVLNLDWVLDPGMEAKDKCDQRDDSTRGLVHITQE